MSPSLNPRYFALIPAAGVGARMGSTCPKQYLNIAGKAMLQHSVTAFLSHPQIEHVFVVVSRGDEYIATALKTDPHLTVIFCGGATRSESVTNGLLEMQSEVSSSDWVLVHDAARPGLTSELISRLIEAVGPNDVGGLLALPVSDTVKSLLSENKVTTISRQGLWLAQTPQQFRHGQLLSALTEAKKSHQEITDEASAIELTGLSPKLVVGHRCNTKITQPDDVMLIETYLLNMNQTVSNIRIGQGYDCHALVENRKLIIGGVTILHPTGLAGHSDADVLLHAVTDALFGAAGLGDIGRHFPDTDAQFYGADSRQLLREAMKRVQAAGFVVGNLDATIIAQAPKMAPHISKMVQNIAEDLQVDVGCINIKAKTNEKLGYLGREEGIAAEAVVLLFRKS